MFFLLLFFLISLVKSTMIRHNLEYEVNKKFIKQDFTENVSGVNIYVISSPATVRELNRHLMGICSTLPVEVSIDNSNFNLDIKNKTLHIEEEYENLMVGKFCYFVIFTDDYINIYYEIVRGDNSLLLKRI